MTVKVTNDMTRVNTRISREVNAWLDERSKTTGVPKSTIIHLALETYMTQSRQLSALELSQGTLTVLLDKVEKIEKKLSSADEVKS